MMFRALLKTTLNSSTLLKTEFQTQDFNLKFANVPSAITNDAQLPYSVKYLILQT